MYQEIKKEIKEMTENIEKLDNKDYVEHHKIEYKIRVIEKALAGINYYRAKNRTE